MKYAILIIALMLSGCSSAPRRILMKNCEEAGKDSSLFYCEEIPKREIERGNLRGK